MTTGRSRYRGRHHVPANDDWTWQLAIIPIRTERPQHVAALWVHFRMRIRG